MQRVAKSAGRAGGGRRAANPGTHTHARTQNYLGLVTLTSQSRHCISQTSQYLFVKGEFLPHDSEALSHGPLDQPAIVRAVDDRHRRALVRN